MRWASHHPVGMNSSPHPSTGSIGMMSVKRKATKLTTARRQGELRRSPQTSAGTGSHAEDLRLLGVELLLGEHAGRFQLPEILELLDGVLARGSSGRWRRRLGV